MGLAAQNGNLQILRILADCTRKLVDVDFENDNIKCMELDYPKKQRLKKNVGYFVVCKELEELGDGPTPDGMEALEWDMEISGNDGRVDEEDVETQAEISIYKWYAKILNQTSFVLKSPENDIGRLDRHGRNVLHYAVGAGHVEMVQYLIENFEKEIGVNQTTNDWLSPLHLGVIGEHIQIIKYLIQKGANVNSLNSKRETPLHYAVHKNNFIVVNLLLEFKANVNLYDNEDLSALSIAILNGNEDIAKALIEAGTWLNHEESYGYTVLHRSVWKDLYNTTKMLLEKGAKIVHSHYLMHVATRNDNIGMVKLLHKFGGLLNVRDEQGNTPLMLACKNHNISIASYHLQNGAQANTVNHINGMSALHICVQEIHDPILFEQFLMLLIKFRANLNANSYQGNVLFYSIILGNLKCATILIKHGVDVNTRDEQSYFDNLSLAMKNGNLDLVRLLMHAGFSLNNNTITFDLKSLKLNNNNNLEDAVHNDVDEDDQQRQRMKDVYNYLVYCKTNPLSLREMCRIRIRKTLGEDLITKINSLPLPLIILKYLALELY